MINRTLPVILVCLLALAATARATEPPPPDRTLSPYFHIEGESGSTERFPLKNTAVNATLNGVIADVRVTQVYANEGEEPIHARYIFPASTRAAVHGMRMQVGEQVVAARVAERRTAQKTFTQAKKAGKSASLLTEERPNVFSMKVANILPGDTIRIELHYTELLVPTDGVYEFVYPTVVGPRYSTIPEAGAEDHHQWLKNPYLKAGTLPASRFEMSAHLTSPLPIQDLLCPSHETDTAWQGQSETRITLAASETRGNNRDFILRYRLADNRIQTGLMLHKGPEENFFMMMMQPPERVQPEAIPPREFIFVVDVSGSMNGFPIETAKSLLGNLIAGLGPADTFNVVLFAGGSKVMAPRSLNATPANIDRAKRLMDGEQGGGGTELARGLNRALGLPRTEGTSRTVLVVTDGYIAIEKEVFTLIRENLNRTNVFAFGIGSSVNRYLIEGIARAGRGEPFVVTEEREAVTAAARFKAYIEAPLLTRIAVEYQGIDVYDLEPAAFGDLFAGRPLVVCGKWRGRPEGRLRVTGLTGTGPFDQTYAIEPSLAAPDNSALPRLWARMRLSRLADFSASMDTEAAKAEITALGLAHHLLTPFTAFVAVDETVRNTGGGREVNQPLPLPLHVSNLAVGGGRRVPEPELHQLAPLLLLGFLVAAIRRRCRNRRRLPEKMRNSGEKITC